MNLKYNLNPILYKRFPTREVMVGKVGIGGNNPIRVQSMTTSDTCDTESTVKQIVELSNVGCEIVRLTVPSMSSAENLPSIREKLKNLKVSVPIVADIHFTPSVALKVVEYVEKIRINPGNFADKKKFAEKEYTEKEYSLELERISDIFLPLVRRCKELGVAMRIGTNHGSLSDRIMNRYGDTPMGMVESAMEFIKIAESENYRDIIVSMKASNPQVMVGAYRLLVSRFIEENLNYPLHLGVTEAGDGRDGRIKSSIGIGTLLDDGIGDTIRVSLTEDSIYEIPVAKNLVHKYNYNNFNEETLQKFDFEEFRNPYSYEKCKTESYWLGEYKIGENYPVRIESFIDLNELKKEAIIKIITENAVSLESQKFEVFHFGVSSLEELNTIENIKKVILNKGFFSIELNFNNFEDILNSSDNLLIFEKICIPFKLINLNLSSFLVLQEKNSTQKKSIEIQLESEDLTILSSFLQKIDSTENILFSLNTKNERYISEYRILAGILLSKKFPLLLSIESDTLENSILEVSKNLGSLLLDGIGNSIRIKIPKTDPSQILAFSYDILQAVRLRTTKTEFISCPSCGRTLFNLQDTTARIKNKTGHLKGVKIAIMGCIVNGPGEMADADFGYVGAGPGKVHLYLGKEIVSKNINSEIADEKLIELIKSNGKWVDP
jgi:(E)-4-hydroxy-3-methylbut-2-enyl-diphosphate synthase